MSESLESRDRLAAPVHLYPVAKLILQTWLSWKSMEIDPLNESWWKTKNKYNGYIIQYEISLRDFIFVFFAKKTSHYCKWKSFKIWIRSLIKFSTVAATKIFDRLLIATLTDKSKFSCSPPSPSSYQIIAANIIFRIIKGVYIHITGILWFSCQGTHAGKIVVAIICICGTRNRTG